MLYSSQEGYLFKNLSLILVYCASSSLASESLSESDPQSMESSLPASSSIDALVTLASAAEGSEVDL